MKKLLIFLAVAVIVAVIWLSFLTYKNGALFSREEVSQITSGEAEMRGEVPYEIEEVASGLSVPWSIVFTSPDRILLTERQGRIRVIENSVLRETPLRTFAEVSHRSEEGLMGLELDPDYSKNKYIYASLAYSQGGAMYVKVLRFKDEGDTLSEEKVLVDKIPAAANHAGSKLQFGPDRKLYISTGDATDKDLPQDIASLGGKILRMNPDGSAPPDNPFPNSLVWSYGHRNPQGITWDGDGNMYATEHGPSGFDGPGGGDEVNRIEKGKNYGWPLVSHDKVKDGTEKPLYLYTPAVAPSGVMAYSGKLFPQFKNNLFFGALKGQGLFRLVIDGNDPSKVISSQKIGEVSYGRIREVAEGPDGSIYFSTSNRDGRGKPASSDDRIFRIVPKK